MGVLQVWIAWDWILSRWARLRPVRPGGVLRYSLRRHRGHVVRLRDGAEVQRGDLLLEVHLDNRAMIAVASESPWQRLQAARDDLEALARMVRRAELGEVRAVHGLTLLGTAGQRLGFEVRPLPHTRRWALERFFMVGLDAVFHPDGTRRLDRRGAERWPSELWMSRRRLLGIPTS